MPLLFIYFFGFGLFFGLHAIDLTSLIVTHYYFCATLSNGSFAPPHSLEYISIHVRLA